MWKWEHGRQGGGYSKLALAVSKRFRFDCYLLWIPVGCEIRRHKDPAQEGFEHHRINLTLWFPKWGGQTFIFGKGHNAAGFLEPRRIYHFRPDERPHCVNAPLQQPLVLLSFGWLRKVRK